MLRDEYRVAAVGRLLAVLGRMGGSKSLLDQLESVPAYGLRPAQLGDGAVATAQLEARPKRLRSQPVQQCVDAVRGHEVTIRPTFWNSLMSE